MTPFRPNIRPALFLLWLTTLLLPSGCAWFVPIPASPPFDSQKTQLIVSAMQKQGETAYSLVSSGAVTLEAQGIQSEAEVLIVARRDPLAVMIDITHAWGQPLFHIQVKGSLLEVISFYEKRHYRGRLGSPWMLKHIPFPLDLDIIWSLARAYPALPPHHLARSMKGYQVTLMDEQGTDMQIMDLYPDTHLPQKVRLCRYETVMSFADFQERDGILYATNIQVSDTEKTSLLALDIREIDFNRPIPEAIFEQAAPPGFEVVPL